MRTFIKGEKRTNRTRDLRSSRPDGLQLSYGVCFGNVPSNESTLGKAVVHNLTLYRIRKKTPINIPSDSSVGLMGSASGGTGNVKKKRSHEQQVFGIPLPPLVRSFVRSSAPNIRIRHRTRVLLPLIGI